MITNSGLRLGERYVLQERLAIGGMGEVWSALDESLNRPVAVKVLRDDLAPDSAFQARFRAEARTAAMLSHGGIAAVFDYGEADGSAYLVMELVPGEPLSAMIANEGALGTDRTLQIVSQAARALHAAHRHGVIHRDIKPANLMVTPELRVKVTDFGIARPRDHEPLTATGQVMGTAHYLAPELARGEIASPLSDVYALGVVAYECLVGWRPFDGDNQIAVATAHLQDEPPALPGTVPAPVRNIVMAAMAKNPAQRPQGANALAALMEDARLRGLGGRTPGGAAGGARPPARPAPSRASAPREPAGSLAGGWPVDAATPPRGTRASSRRAAQSQPSQPSQPSGPPGHYDPPDQYESLDQYGPLPEYRPLAEYGPPGRGDLTGPSDPPGRYGAPGRRGDGDRARPAAAFAGGHSRGGGSGPAHAAHATGRRHGPDTSVIPKAGGRPGRRLTIPLVALVALILLVVVAGVLAHRNGSNHGLRELDRFDRPSRLGPAGPTYLAGPGSPIGLLAARDVRETG